MRHFTRVRRPFHVRLACVRHAASVQSEPESNSPVEKYLIQRTEVLKSNSKLYFPTRSSLVKEPCRSLAAVLLYATFRFRCQQLFSKFFQRSAFGVGSFEPLCLSAFSSYARFTPFCQTLFSHFSGNFSPILRILPIKLTIGNKNSSFFLFRRTAFFPGKQKNRLIPPF